MIKVLLADDHRVLLDGLENLLAGLEDITCVGRAENGMEVLQFLNDNEVHAEITETMRAGKTVGGHYASRDLGLPFHAYVAGGPQDDHEGTQLEDGIARVRQGMRAMLRLGSAWYDVASQVKAITEEGLDSRNFILCTDDSHSGTLVREGHMNRVVRHAIAQGLRPITAIQMATLNTAQHFGLESVKGPDTFCRKTLHFAISPYSPALPPLARLCCSRP